MVFPPVVLPGKSTEELLSAVLNPSRRWRCARLRVAVGTEEAAGRGERFGAVRGERSWVPRGLLPLTPAEAPGCGWDGAGMCCRSGRAVLRRSVPRLCAGTAEGLVPPWEAPDGLLPISYVVSSNTDKDHLGQLCLLVQSVQLLHEAHERAASACLPEAKSKAAV